MSKVRLAVATLGLAMILPAASALLAQTASVAPAAPLPSQILTAKKAFISNAGGELDPRLWSGGPAQLYNQLYAAIKSSGQYQLVAAPADADLVIEVSFADPTTGVSGSKESGCSSSSAPQLDLVLRDPKTNVVLWTISEKTSIAHMQKGRDQALADSIGSLIADLKALAAQPTDPNVAK
jgi:hypothetical protein